VLSVSNDFKSQNNKDLRNLKRNNSERQDYQCDSFSSFEEEEEVDVKSLIFHDSPAKQKSLSLYKRNTTIRVSSQSLSDGSQASEIKNYEQEVNKGEEQFEIWRKKITIPTTSTLLQVWRVIGIILSFTTSFNYAYYATFYHKLD